MMRDANISMMQDAKQFDDAVVRRGMLMISNGILTGVLGLNSAPQQVYPVLFRLLVGFLVCEQEVASLRKCS